MTGMESMKKFTHNVHWYRERAKMSISELARRSGLPLAMLEALEQGVIPESMMVDDALGLANAFGCEVYKLFE